MIPVRIKPELEEELQRASQANGLSKSAYIRNIIEEKLQQEREMNLTPWELGKSVFGKEGSGRNDLSSNRKTILKEKLRAKTGRH
jgi:RHH-type rel operon transcriptional repressor/antitoxin RelB